MADVASEVEAYMQDMTRHWKDGWMYANHSGGAVAVSCILKNIDCNFVLCFVARNIDLDLLGYPAVV